MKDLGTSQTRRYITLWNVNVSKLAIIWKNSVCQKKLNLNVLIDLCHSKYSKCPTVARMQTWRRLRRCSMTSSITRCSTQSDAASNHSHLALFLVDLSLNYAPNFVVSWIDVKAVRRPQILSHRSDHDLLHYCILRQRMMQNIWVNTACGKVTARRI